jgi:uncharacterized membrane protein
MIGRAIGTFVTLIVWGWINFGLNVAEPLVSGPMAGRQFENSDAQYVVSQYGMRLVSGIGGLVSFIALVILILIWWGPARKALAEAKKNVSIALAALALSAALLAGTPQNAQAFFEKTDRTEVYSILPNQSAFWIPDVGANKDTQAKMDSEAYLNENKIAQKRYVIPHQKLTGSAGTNWSAGWDYYVPTGRLIIVDRTPFSREWVDAHDRGTSKSKEGFPCQTKEGLNVTAGVSIGTSVLEVNAAKFLYRFGVNAPVEKLKGDAANIDADGKIIFASVYYGRSLKEVMDDVGRKKVQTLVCNEIGGRTLEKANDEMIKLMGDIETKVRTYFESVGITLDFIGWGDTFTFDEDVQKAVNRLYVAKQDESIAKLLASHTATIDALSRAQAIRSFGEKTDGKFPTTFVGPAPEVTSPLLSLPGAQRTLSLPTAPSAPAKP